ncbi:MAG TPA: bifunctional riboflavin kinase/FAD synthetase [Desulfobacteraceae bacterium]|nr:bifunctional riboflavin kinase/FAD synthetase [Desulfobacteraceae bacterium]
MKLYTTIDDISTPFFRACVTIGNFDGVHLGHQQLFREVVSRASRVGGTSVVVTFDPHPLKVLRPGAIRLISTTEQKIELIEKAGIDVLVIIPFDLEFAATGADEFVEEILIRRIGVRELVVGYDYAFGRGRQGNIEFLRAKGRERGFPVTVVEAFYTEGMLVSSTRIRELVADGRMGEVRKLLGRYYQIRGEVQRGKQRGGRVVGFPTANLRISEEDLCPRRGVYVTQVIYDGRCYGGVSNIGYNPTFGDNRLVAETHIFDFHDDIYGKPIRINLLQHLREERKFSGPEELAAQILKDIGAAREVLESAQKELLLSCEESSSR